MRTLSEWLAATPAEREHALLPCSDRIRAADGSLRAWVDVRPQPPTGSGPLAFVPFGAKDIFETRGLATEYGSPIYQGRIGTSDAALVSDLRRRGAVLMGKTATTAFAYRAPAQTRNPHDAAHTPGGSSSGSAAAVAAGMVPVALGTQTLGSVLRPASFCGVTGFKPTFGVLPFDGVLPCAPSLDTAGLFTHGAADMLALWEALGHDLSASSSDDIVFGAAERLPGVDSDMAAAYATAVARVKASGIAVQTVEIADRLVRLYDAARVVMAREAATVHHDRYEEYGDRLDVLADLVREGRSITTDAYDAARLTIVDERGAMSAQFRATPVMLVPAATGRAPRGRESTGDPAMNAPWTALGTPAISVPLPVDGLPLGLQLTADRGGDARVLRAAVRVQSLLTA